MADKVGQVTLEAVIEGHNLKGQLESQLSADVFAKVMPKIDELNAHIAATRKQMEGVKATPFEDIAKQAGIATDINKGLEKSIDAINLKQRQLDRQAETTRKNVEARTAAQKAYNDELKKTGTVSDATAKRLTAAKNRAQLDFTELQARQDALERAGQVAADTEVALQNRVAKAVEAARQRQVNVLQDVIDASHRQMQAVVNDGIKQTNAHNANVEKWLAAERKYTAKVKAENDKRIRDNQRAADKQLTAALKIRDKEQRAKAVAAARQAQQDARDAADAARKVEAARSTISSPFRGAQRDILSAVGLNPRMGSGAFQGLVLSATAAAGAVASATQALWALPAAVTAAGAAFAVLDIGTSGFADTIKALVAGDLDKFDAAIQHLSPNAQQLALALQQLKPVLGAVKDQIQDALFSGSTDMLVTLVRQFLPVLDQAGVQIASVFNGMLRDVFSELTSTRGVDLVNQILGGIVTTFQRLAPAVKPLTDAFLVLSNEGMKFLPQVADMIVRLSNTFDDFITKNAANGKLQEWMRQGMSSVIELTKVVYQLGRVFMSLAPVAEQVLPYIVSALKSLADLMNRHPAFIYEMIAAFLALSTAKGLFNFMRAIKDLLEMLGTSLPAVLGKLRGSFASAWGRFQLPQTATFANFTSAADRAAGVVYQRYNALSDRMKSIFNGKSMWSGFTASMDRAASVAYDKFNRLSDRVRSVAAAAQGLSFKGVASSAAGALGGGIRSTAGKAASAAGGAAKGIAAGALGVAGLAASAAVPILGTAAVIGSGILIDQIIDKNIKSSQALDGYRDSAEKARQSQIDLNAALLASGGAFDEAARAAASSHLGDILDQLDKGSQSHASFADKFRTPGGGFQLPKAPDSIRPFIQAIPLVGSYIDMLGSDSPSKSDEADAAAAKNRDALADIHKLLGSDPAHINAQVLGDQSQFDATIAALQKMGDAGKYAADKMAEYRQETLGFADMAKDAGPLILQMGDDTTASVTRIRTAFAAMPTDVPIKITDRGGDEVVKILQQLKEHITVDPNTKEISLVKGPDTDKVLAMLTALGVQVRTDLHQRLIIDAVNLDAVKRDLDKFKNDPRTAVGAAAIPGVPAPGAKLEPTPTRPSLFDGIDLGIGLRPPAVPPVPNAVPPVPNANYNNLPVPPNPLDDRGNKITDADKRKAIEDDILKNQSDKWKVPMPQLWGPGQAPPQVVGGALSVNVQNLPSMGGMGSMMPGVIGGGVGSGPSLWDAVMKAEGGTWDNADTGHNGHFGGLQFAPKTWEAFGGLEFAPRADQATREQQIEIANRTAFTGYNGQAPQGLAAWEAITKGNVPGVTVNTPQSAFMGGGGGMFLPGAGQIDLSNLPDAKGAHPQIALLEVLANKFGLSLTAGKDDHPMDQGYHPRGEAGDFGNGDQTAQETAFTNFLAQNFGPYLAEVIHSGPGTASNIKNGKATPVIDQPGSIYNSGQAGYHGDHVHVAITDQMAQAFSAAVQRMGLVPGGFTMPQALGDKMYAQNGPVLLGQQGAGYYQTDTEAQMQAYNNVIDRKNDLEDANRNLLLKQQDATATQADILEAQQKQAKAQQAFDKSQMDYAKAAQGEWKNLDLSDPRKIAQAYGAGTGQGFFANFLNNLGIDSQGIAGTVGPPGGQGGGLFSGLFGRPSVGAQILGQGLGQLLGGLGNPLGSVAGNAVAALGGTYTSAGPAGDPNKLLQEGNLAGGAATVLGYQVPTFYQNGGGASAQNLMQNQGPGFGANGQMQPDTAALTDRTQSSGFEVMQDQLKQVMDVLNQVRQQLTKEVLGPIIEDAVKAGTQGLQDSINALVTPPPSTGQGHADGGVLPGYSPGVDNLRGRVGGRTFGLSGGEGILIPEAVRGLGGASAIYAINSRYRSGLSRAGYASGGVVAGNTNGNGNATIGADLLGLGQVPIIGPLINMLVQIFLEIIGVNIAVRNTLSDMTQEIRSFRGDFAHFDASGRLAGDTSALTARSDTSKATAEQQRLNALKQIIIGALTYVIQNIIVPVIQAVFQSLINFGGQLVNAAVGAGVSTVAPGAGGLASGISSAVTGVVTSIADQLASVLVKVIGQVLTSGASVLVNMLGDALHNLFPTLFGAIAGGLKGVGSLFTGVFQGLLSPFVAIGHALHLFDEGGLAVGAGLMQKNVIAPERVLSPSMTPTFERFMDYLEATNGGIPAGGSTVHVGQQTNHITVTRAGETADAVEGSLMSLI